MRRRRFLAAGAAVLGAPFIACSRKSSGGTPPGILHDSGIDPGHRLRPGGAPFPPPTEEQRVPVLIVGAGIGGLSAAWRLQRRGWHDFTVLELADRPGGNTRFVDHAENPVSAHPLGAHYLPLPTREAVHVRELLSDLGALSGDPHAARPTYDELRLCHTPQERLYRNGQWQEGIIPQQGLPRAERDEIRRFLDRMEEFRAARDPEGRRAFALPAELSSPAPRWRALDRITMAQWLADAGFKSAALRWYVDYACRDDFGTGLAETSAWAGIHYFACRNGEAANAAADAVLTAPEGNGWIVRALTERIGPRLHSGQLAVALATAGPEVLLDVWHAAGQRVIRYRTRQLIWAAPLFLLPRLAQGLPADLTAAIRAQSHAPWLVANLTLDQAPAPGAGAGLAWDNVLYGSAGLGYVVATHQNIRLASGPTVITWYQALASPHFPSPAAARASLLDTPRETWAERILGELAGAHADIRRITRRLDIVRHGHAMARPTPGALWGTERQRLLAGWTRPKGGPHITFAHADVSGFSLFEEANFRGVQAADQVLRRL